MPGRAVLSTNGPGGGTTLSPPPIPPGRVLHAVAFTPAVRGYPGGIADMAAEQSDLAPGDVLDGRRSWAGAPAAEAAPGAGPAAPALGTSVWQQSVAAWQEAGIDWLREKHPGPSAEDHTAAEADLQHTEPIPVVPAFDPRDQAAAAGRAEDAVDEDLVVLSATETTAAPSETAAAAAGAAPGQNTAGVDDDVIVLRDAGAAAATGQGEAGNTEAGAGSGAAARRGRD